MTKYNFSSIVVGVEFSDIFRGVIYPDTNSRVIASLNEKIFPNMDRVFYHFVNTLQWNGKDKNTPAVYTFNGVPEIIGIKIVDTTSKAKLDEQLIQDSKKKMGQLLLENFDYNGEISIFVTNDYLE